MNSEKEFIKIIAGAMPRSDMQLNGLFEADAEIVTFGDRKLLFNIDEFSQEDFLRDHDPYVLGWNIAVGSISDILAAGGKPLYYLHSIVTGEGWNAKYIKSFARGIADVLKETGTAFIGGDLGKSKEWRYTATVIGEHQGVPLKRSGACIGDAVYITGEIGLGNLEAFLKLYSQKPFAGTLTKAVEGVFKIRLLESALISKYAASCIDTSDGAYSAINSISQMSNTGYELKNLPYIKAGVLASRLASIPKTLLFLGECGEYELLFTISKKNEECFMEEAKAKGLKFYRIGNICGESRNVLCEGDSEVNLRGLNISARDFEDVKEYIKRLEDFLKESQIYE